MITSRHRWFQFRLSTWFVLVAILGWAMACRPLIVSTFEVADTKPVGRVGAIPLVVNLHQTMWTVHHDELNPGLKWPILALAAFVAWKAGWAVQHRRRKSTAPE
jgi:hypothetical protein